MQAYSSCYFHFLVTLIFSIISSDNPFFFKKTPDILKGLNSSLSFKTRKGLRSGDRF